MAELNRNKLADVVRSTNGGFFGVDFVKKDGTLRRMTCRKGVYKVETLAGKPSTVDRPDTPYVTVWDRYCEHRFTSSTPKYSRLPTQFTTTRGIITHRISV